MTAALKRLIAYSVGVLVLSIGYFVYTYTQLPPSVERETFLNEIGEGVGEIALWALVFIYARTVLKLCLGKGAISKRLIPEYSPPASAPKLRKLTAFLDRTHVHVGIASVALILLHVSLMGAPFRNLFFTGVLVLIAWQTAFGLFLRTRSVGRNIKKFSYSVHAQLFTGVMIGLFGFFGHALVLD